MPQLRHNDTIPGNRPPVSRRGAGRALLCRGPAGWSGRLGHPQLAAPAGSRLAAMRCAGSAAMLELMAPSPPAGLGAIRIGVVMAGANGSDARATVAVIGAGIMGAAMTRSLVAAGLITRGWGRSPS